MEKQQCDTCRWWCDVFGELAASMRVCVLLNGMRDTLYPKVSFGGSKPLKTHGSFACSEWMMKDERSVN